MIVAEQYNGISTPVAVQLLQNVEVVGREGDFDEIERTNLKKIGRRENRKNRERTLKKIEERWGKLKKKKGGEELRKIKLNVITICVK